MISKKIIYTLKQLYLGKSIANTLVLTSSSIYTYISSVQEIKYSIPAHFLNKTYGYTLYKIIR